MLYAEGGPNLQRPARLAIPGERQHSDLRDAHREGDAGHPFQDGHQNCSQSQLQGSQSRCEEIAKKVDQIGVFLEHVVVYLTGEEEKAKEDAAKAAAQLAGVSQLTGNVNTGGGKGIASSGVASGNVDPSGMGGGSRQAKSSGSQNTGRTDGGWGWKDGGLVTMFKLKG